MKKITTILTSVLGCGLAVQAHAFDAHEVGQVAVTIDPSQHADNGFWCTGKWFNSDIPLPDFHGCEVEPVTFGQFAQPALLMHVYYGWNQSTEDGKSSAKTQTFIEVPNGHVFRLRDTTFITSPMLVQEFRLGVGLPENLTNTSLTLPRVSARNFQAYGQTFCVSFNLREPFSGALAWCQGDRVIAGQVGYISGYMPFPQAAMVAQTYIYDANLRVPAKKLMSAQTVVGFSKDANGPHWVFVVPAQGVSGVSAYRLRVYMNSFVMLDNLTAMPVSPDFL